MKYLCLVILVVMSCKLQAQLNVVPMPADVQLTGGVHRLAQPISFVYDKKITNIERGVGSFKKVLQKQNGIQSVKNSGSSKSSLIKVRLDQALSPEEYRINISPKEILIKGAKQGYIMRFKLYLK